MLVYTKRLQGICNIKSYCCAHTQIGSRNSQSLCSTF